MNISRHASVLAVAWIALLAKAAGAATSVSVAPAGGLGALGVSVDVASRSLHYVSCPVAPCVATEASPVVPITGADAPLDASSVAVEDVTLAGGRHLVHVKVPLESDRAPEARAWEALIVAGAPPLYTGVTGWSRGEPGERTGTDVRLLASERGATVVIGEIREDLRICGDPATLLDPRGLDPSTLQFKGATLQRLSGERRSQALAITATPRRAHPEPALAPLLRATDASSSLRPEGAAALTDGDLSTTWSEARPGRGQGEFVLMQAPFDVPIVRFSLVATSAPPSPAGAAPKTFYLATSGGTYEVTLPEDAWSHPGEAYDITLPRSIQTSCVALVLDDAWVRGEAHPEVTVAELVAYSELDHSGATLAEVAKALSGGGGRAGAAAALLERAGPAGLAAATTAFASLDASGRALAVNIAASSPSCSGTGSLLVLAVGDADSVVRQKALSKLTEPACGREAMPALLAGLTSADVRARVAPLVALLAREKALDPLMDALGEGPATDRAALRAATAAAARDATPSEIERLLERASGRPPAVGLESLRALTARLGDVQPAADRLVDRLFAASTGVDVRYRLVDVLAPLAAENDTDARGRLADLVLHDPSPELRAHAAEHALDARDADAVLAHALTDAAPRVREAALNAVSRRKHGGVESLTPLLDRDPWTFVRVAAAGALASLPASEASDRALGAALGQLAPRVKEQAIVGLAAHGARAYAPSIQELLESTSEDPTVRAASARALGALCHAKAEDPLVELTLRGASSPDAAAGSLGLEATAALGDLHPADLAARLAPLRGKGVRPDARAAGDRALASAGVCGLPRSKP